MKHDQHYSSICGKLAGPVLHVLCSEETRRVLMRRLRRIPSLPYMRGAILLSSTDGQRDLARKLEMIDDEISVPTPERHAVFTVLHHAASLGMIEGRGIPVRAI